MNTDYNLHIALLNSDQEQMKFLDFRWTDGAGHIQGITIGLDLETHAGGQEGLRENLSHMLQHVYLSGFRDGAYESFQARHQGYQDGMIDGAENPYENLDARFGSWANGRTQRRADHDTGVRIEGLVGQRAELTGVRDSQAALLNERQERIEAMEAQIVGLNLDIAGVAEQRDVMAEGLNHIQAGLLSASVPTVMTVDNDRAVTIYRGERGNFNVQPWGAMVEDQTAEQLATLLRGALADAYHAGQNESVKVGVESELRNQVTQLEGRVSYLQEELSAADHDARTIADALLNEAEERRWCSEYDEFVEGVNRETNRHKLTVRSQEYSVSIRVTQSIDWTVVDTAARDAGFSDSYDVSDADAEATYHFTVECNPNEIDRKVEQLRRAVYSVSGVSSASADYEEAD